MRLFILSLFFFQLSILANESGYLYNNKNNVSIFYDKSTNKYIVTNELGEFKYDRRNYQRMLDAHLSTISQEDRSKVKAVVSEHAKITIATTPSLEEVLSSQLDSIKKLDTYLETKTKDCYQGHANDEIQLKLTEDNEQQIIDLQLEEQGFVNFGKLKSINLELLSSNDNPLHGALGAAGITSWASGIEGDDRGKTFGYNMSATAEFEQGEVTLRKTSTGYARLKPREGNKYLYNGKIYTSKIYNDEEGKRYQEFLSIDTTEVEIKRLIGSNDLYLKVIGRQKVMDDTSGDSKAIQEKWHSTTSGTIKDGGVEYHYLDYMKKRSGVEAYVEVGKKLDIYEKDDVTITTTPYVGVQASSLGESERFVKVGGDLKVVFNDKDKDEKFPNWEVRFYGEAKHYDDGRKGHTSGLSLTKNITVTENSVVYLKAGAEYNHDRYSVDYSAEEIKRNGRLDIDHQLGIGFKYKFK